MEKEPRVQEAQVTQVAGLEGENCLSQAITVYMLTLVDIYRER